MTRLGNGNQTKRSRCFRGAAWRSLVLLLLAAAAARAEPAGYVLRTAAPPSDSELDEGYLDNLRFVGDLLRNGFAVHWVADAPQGTGARRGDFLVPLDQEESDYLRTLLASLPADRLVPVGEGATFEVYPLRRPRILLDAQAWTSNYNWYYDTLAAGEFEFEHLVDPAVTPLDAAKYNLFIAPGGGGRIPSAYNRMLRGYVAGGGNYIGSCWGAAQALYPSKVSYGTGNGAGLVDAHNNETVHSFGALGGVGHVVLRNESPEHPIMWNLPAEIHNIYWNGPVMEPGPHARCLASFVDVVADDFRFHSDDAAERQADVSEERGKCLYLTSRRPGEGTVTLFGDHPEASDSINPFRAHAMGPRAVYNAILYATAGPREAFVLRSPPAARSQPKDHVVVISCPPPPGLEAIRAEAAALREHVDRLLDAGDDGRFTEDDPAGFFLLRCRSAVENVAKGVMALQLVSPEGDERGESLRRRLDQWVDRTQSSLTQLDEDLATLNPRRMNRRDAGWQPIVGPIFERSLELVRLERDLAYRRANLNHEGANPRR